jgi:hypothetical protein
VQLKTGGWYITVIMFDRYPSLSRSTFESCQAEWTVDAEGLVVRQVAVERMVAAWPGMEAVSVGDEELERIETLCAVRLNL